MPLLSVNGDWSPAKNSPYVTETKTQASANAYASMGSIWIGNLTKMTISVRETGGAKDVLFKIDVSMDGTVWKNIMAEDTLSASEHHYETLSDAWRWLRVQIKSALADNHGAVEAILHGEKM